MKKSKANANNPTESKAKHDDCSVASSLSSIPLKDLKKHLARQQQQQQQQRKKRNNHTNKPYNSKRKKPGIQKKTTTTNGTNDRAIQTSKMTATRRVSKPKMPNLTKNGNGAHPPASTSFTTSTSGSTLSSTHSDQPLAMACCLCHCGLDCADRALFFPTDRLQEQQPNDNDHDNEDDNHDDNIIEFTMDDPYIPIQAHDPHNALVYCDGCSRLYHQKCHFVPLLIIPRGKWFCLLCTTSTSMKPTTITTMTTTDTPTTSTAAWNPESFFQSPPIPSARIWEQQWERQTGTDQAKLWHQQLAQTRQFCKTQASNIRLASTQLETMISISRNRQHLLATLSKTYYKNNKVNNRQNQRVSSSSQQLADTLFKLTSSQWKLRTVLMSLEQYQRRGNHILPTRVVNWAQHQGQAQFSASNDNVVNSNHHPTNKVMAYLFPHGLRVYLEHGRTIPRTAEWKGYNNDDDHDEPHDEPMEPTTAKSTTVPSTSAIPLEISIFDSPSPSTVALPTAPSSPPGSNHQQPPPSPQQPTDKKKIAVQPHNKDKKIENDNDSGISLDDLQCCICRVGDATDENDLLLCDGEGCCRAFHMACVWPALTLDDVQDHEDEDWFCPLCQAIPNLLAELQEACMDEEWVYRKATSQHQTKDDDGNASRSSSLQSWNCAADVFPESEWQMQASKLLRLGPQQQNQQEHEEQTIKDSIARLLGTFLGPDFVPTTGNRHNNEQSLLPIGSDSEDENDYSLFDEASFEERKRQKRATKEKNNDDNDGDDDSSRHDNDSGNKEDDDSSTRSSQVTLQEMSSVELEIDDDELAALSDGGGGSGGIGGDDGQSLSSASSTLRHRRRVSKRLRNKVVGSSVQSGGGDGGSSRDDDEVNLADFDPSNIVEGKRRRTSVDYRKLNDALFGDLTAVEQAKLDDQLDYEDHSLRVKKKKRTTKTTTTKKKRPSEHPNGRVQSIPAGRRKNVTIPRRTNDQNSSDDEEEEDREEEEDDDNESLD